MFVLKVSSILLFFINITYSMYYLTDFHAHYPDAHVIVANCSETVSLSCPIGFENNSSSTVPTMWFRLYENAYPQPLILGDRQLIDDQRFMIRTQNTDRHLEIVGIRKDDEGYYLCKSGNDIQTSYNITIRSNSCIEIIPNLLHTNSEEPIQIVCRIRSIEDSDEVNFHVEWTRNDYLLDNNLTESSSNYSSTDGILYETLIIKNATRNDTGIYKCRYGHDLMATAQIIVNQYPGGSKSRRLISQLRGNSSLSRASLRTNMNFIATIAIFFCISAVSIHAAEKCPGSSVDSQEDFKWKYDAAPIVVYGTASEVRNNLVSFTIKCLLKGSLTAAKLELPQLPEVSNLTECHYLAANRNYIVFIETMKTTGADSKTLYKFADMEEIEINADTATTFMKEECEDEEDDGIEMTMFYASNDRQCNKFTATCNSGTKSAIIAQNFPPLTKSTTFLGGYKKAIDTPNENGSDRTISGKKNGGFSDDDSRNAAATSTISMSLVIFFTGLFMMFRI
ncbi:hypothetical protein I4U23_002911 [Adineta vaga]|nr:hypothetical protein I4U23_002911 [Adineta vaga]